MEQLQMINELEDEEKGKPFQMPSYVRRCGNTETSKPKIVPALHLHF